MSIETYYTTTFSVERMAYTGDKSALSTVGTFVGHLQQAIIDTVEFYANRFTITHSVWCATSTDVQVGDVLTVGSDVYTVRALQKNLVGNNEHYELAVEQSK